VTTTITSFSPALDALRLASGQKVTEADQGFLYSELARIVPNFSHNLGRADAVALYARHLQAIHDEAGRAAVAAWLAANKGA
jgi:hypothetical protein